MARSTPTRDLKTFLAHWPANRGSEDETYETFFRELCDVLDVPAPTGETIDDRTYCFQYKLKLQQRDGTETDGKIDVFRRGSFVLEFKKGSNAGDDRRLMARRGTPGWDSAMRRAFGQAREYHQNLARGEQPPFLITCDIGASFHVWNNFGSDFGGYGAARRIAFADLADPAVRDFLRAIFLDPESLNPTGRAIKVTQAVAGDLAKLARSLEQSGHDPELVAQFLMRCIFTFFAEDVGLLPAGLFSNAIAEDWLPEPRRFQSGIESLWRAMDQGGPFGSKMLRQFNGGLFRAIQSLPLDATQLQILHDAGKHDWSAVEPAIFGTLIEQALNERERAQLGAHFTPRSYIERLVRPTVIEPLLEEWQAVQAVVHATLAAVKSTRRDELPVEVRNARAQVHQFHKKLCRIRVLDPACGTGNFLYVTLALLKDLEREIRQELRDLGDDQDLIEELHSAVSPGQFFGLEINSRARAIADLVLWLGYLQWYRRFYGDRVREPVLRDYKNIECKDALIKADKVRPMLDAAGDVVTRWDGESRKKHPVTGKLVPDESKRVDELEYVNPREVVWPKAEYIIGNPPFIGAKDIRTRLGDGYARALWETFNNEVPKSADYVMYWWHRAAHLVANGRAERFGFITTNSIRQVFNRRIIQRYLDAKVPIRLRYGVPDHPWVTNPTSAAVRIAMTVGVRPSYILDTDGSRAEKVVGELAEVVREHPQPDGTAEVEVLTTTGNINADLTIGTNVASSVALKANAGLAHPGYKLHGSGFIVTKADIRRLLPQIAPRHGKTRVNVIHPYLNGDDLTQTSRGVYVIDVNHLYEDDLMQGYPEIYQHLLDHVKPERDQNRRKSYRQWWWHFGEPRDELRKVLTGLRRYIATVETSKHRTFHFLDAEIAPDNMLVCIASDDAYLHGVLSSRVHVNWSLSQGGTLEDRPRYSKTRCFDPFPFPECSRAQRDRIRNLAETLDAHRKQRQKLHPQLTITGMYNVLEKLRTEAELTDAEQAIYNDGLVGVLRKLHDDLDVEVIRAYGWADDITEEEIIASLVNLNKERRDEEMAGVIRWLRPLAQAPQEAIQSGFAGMDHVSLAHDFVEAKPRWPSEPTEQLIAVRRLMLANPALKTAEEVAACFHGARRATVEKHIATLRELKQV